MVESWTNVPIKKTTYQPRVSEPNSPVYPVTREIRSYRTSAVEMIIGENSMLKRWSMTSFINVIFDH